MIVVKIGGSMADNAANLASDIASLVSSGEKVVLVHGGGPQVTALEKAVGREPAYIYSKEGFKSRHTDGQTMQNFVMAVGGGVNSSLVRTLRKSGVNAVGVSGSSGIVFAKRKILVSVENGKERMVRDDYSGKIARIDSAPLLALLERGFVPTVAPIALGEEFEALNVDGDRAAAAIAAKLSASRLILFTDVEGFFANFPNDLVSRATGSEIPEFQKKAAAGMKRKLVATSEALLGGVPEVIICCGTREKPATSALAGGGTHFTK
ncbi:MAG: [LysW]-aminoadipate kinase [Candidatus Micrarchaeota archaeon]|nr:[LysW]-aminoadipate kinase [Candidatus Micrarchaeota archaeon]